ncbi:hypothetical protein QBA38_38495 [Streptomyces stelliscabiei]|uniref:hypothetical protein n=1 Tax=Streptomyces stelliscabiei TaxID=146820 RepID=UPI002FF0A958
MPNTNRTSHTPARAAGHHDPETPAHVSWPRLVSTALLAGALRHAGGILVGLAVAWWHHD